MGVPRRMGGGAGLGDKGRTFKKRSTGMKWRRQRGEGKSKKMLGPGKASPHYPVTDKIKGRAPESVDFGDDTIKMARARIGRKRGGRA